jgi:hypothetical protein
MRVAALDNGAIEMSAQLPALKIVDLASGVWSFQLRGLAVVSCWTGTIWVTGPETGDLVLEPGTRTSLRGFGRVVVQPLEPARFSVE